MEALQRMIRDGVVEGVREGFSSESTAIVLSSSFGFLSLLFPKLDAERTRHLFVLAGFRSLGFHRFRGSAVRRSSSSLLHGLLIRLVGLTPVPGASHLQGVRQAASRGLGDLLHASRACPPRSWDSIFAFTFFRR